MIEQWVLALLLAATEAPTSDIRFWPDKPSYFGKIIRYRAWRTGVTQHLQRITA